MRFLVRSPDGSEREVELEGSVVTVGRDPSCELVIKDPKCSRRHAIIEAGPEGLSVRDNGSANGVFINGRPVEQGKLVPGDLIRLGEVEITVLAEQMEGTLAMGPEDLAALAAAPPPAKPEAPPPAPPPMAQPAAEKPAPAPPPPAAPPAPAPPPTPAPAAAPPPAPPAPAPPPPEKAPAAEPPQASSVFATKAPDSGPLDRPPTVTLLVILWAVAGVLWLTGGSGLGILALSGRLAAGSVAGAILMAAVSGAMAWGLWSASPWARIAQIVCAAIGILNCPFSVASAATLLYMLRPHVKILFSGRNDWNLLSREEAETVHAGAREGLFAGIILANVVLAGLFGGFRLAQLVPPLMQQRVAAGEAAVVAQVRVVVAAQEAFHAACGAGYGDEEGLMNPASAVPGLPAGAPAFMRSGAATMDRFDYHFELTVTERAPQTPGCQRSFRRFEYLAVPLSSTGRSFIATSDGVIHQANGRPATAADPAVP